MGLSPSADNYQLGKGVLYFNQKSGSNFLGFLDLGNAPSFSFNMSQEKLDHYSSRGGLRAKDKSVVAEINPACSFTLDEINAENFTLLTMGTKSSVTQSASSAIDEAITVRKLGTRIQLAYRSVSSVVVQDDADTITYVQGPASNPLANYQIDTSLKDDVIGRILIHADQSGCASAIAVNDVLHVDYDYGAVTYTKISAFVNTVLEGTLHFISDNPVGSNEELKIWRVSLAPEGDTAMIGEDWAVMSFTGEILKVTDTTWDGVDHSANPYMELILDVA